MLAAEALVVGSYELVFGAGAYLRATGQAQGETLFLDEIPIRFGVPGRGALPCAAFDQPLCLFDLSRQLKSAPFRLCVRSRRLQRLFHSASREMLGRAHGPRHAQIRG